MAGNPDLRLLHRVPSRGLCGPRVRDAAYRRRLCVPESYAETVVRVRHGRDHDHHLLHAVAGPRWLARVRAGHLPSAHGPRGHDGQPGSDRVGRLVYLRMGTRDRYHDRIHSGRPHPDQELPVVRATPVDHVVRVPDELRDHGDHVLCDAHLGVHLRLQQSCYHRPRGGTERVRCDLPDRPLGRIHPREGDEHPRHHSRHARCSHEPGLGGIHPGAGGRDSRGSEPEEPDVHQLRRRSREHDHDGYSGLRHDQQGRPKLALRRSGGLVLEDPPLRS